MNRCREGILDGRMDGRKEHKIIGKLAKWKKRWMMEKRNV